LEDIEVEFVKVLIEDVTAGEAGATADAGLSPEETAARLSELQAAIDANRDELRDLKERHEKLVRGVRRITETLNDLTATVNKQTRLVNVLLEPNARQRAVRSGLGL
jgi:chromosome segregation ATPase